MPSTLPGSVLRFADCVLDCGRFELRRNGLALRVERKPMELLILLASQEGRLVTRTEIAQRLWSSEVFVDTEHGINTAIRKLRYLLRDDPDNPQFIQTVTGMGYRFVAPINVVPAEPAAAGGQGLPERRREAASEPSPQPAAESRAAGEPVALPASIRINGARPRVGIAVATSAGLIAALAVLGGIYAFRHLRPRTPVISSIAVLPLDNLSGDPSQEYFADGMTDELTTMLAKDSTLRITSRTSVMQYKGARRPLRDIARALNVDAILEGSVSRSGNDVHMTVQLIRADTDTHLWAESYDRDGDDVDLPDEAARAIAVRLHSATPAAPPPHYLDPAAHNAYLQGKYLWFTDRMEQSGAYFRKAVEIQPDYALAWAGLSDYYGEGVAGDILDPRTSLVPELETARRAVQLDPDLAEAHQAMGAAYLIALWDWPNADRETAHAISLDPRNGEGYYLRACLLQALNRNPEAIELAKKAMELDPFARPYALASIYVGARQYDAALTELNFRLVASPNNPDLIGSIMDVWRRKGNYPEAVNAWEKWYILTGDSQSAIHLHRAFEKGGARGFILWQLGRRTIQAKTQYVSPVELATYHAQLGEREPTLTLLEEGYRQRNTDILWIQVDPAFNFLHTDPRFRAIVRNSGVTPAW